MSSSFSKISLTVLLLTISFVLISFAYVRFTGYGVLGGDSIGSVHVIWADSSFNEEGFSIERSDINSPFAEVAVVGANTATYIDSAVTIGATYFYRVRSYNVNGYSSYSNVVNVTIPLDGSNVTTTISSSGGGGGGGGGGSGGSSGGGINAEVILGNGSQSSGGKSSGESSGSSNSQSSGGNTISGRAIGENLPLGKLSRFGIVFLAGIIAAFAVYKFIYFLVGRFFHHSTDMLKNV